MARPARRPTTLGFDASRPTRELVRRAEWELCAEADRDRCRVALSLSRPKTATRPARAFSHRAVEGSFVATAGAWRVVLSVISPSAALPIVEALSR